MKLFRFMSFIECYQLLQRETLKNKTDHSKKRGSASTAKGFCFGIGDAEQAKKDFRRLKGIVDSEILFVFTLKPESESRFTKCQGRYVDYDKIDAEKKTIDQYPFGLEPKCMVDEFCTNSYSLEDFEEYKFYGTFVDTNKDPSDKDFLELRDLSNPSEEATDDPELKESGKVATKILRLLDEQDITPGRAMLALAISTSMVINFAVTHSRKTHHDCIDDFVDILKSLVFPNNKNQ